MQPLSICGTIFPEKHRALDTHCSRTICTVCDRKLWGWQSGNKTTLV